MGDERSGSFGALLRRYRAAAGLTQEELAERAGLGVRTIAYLEANRTGTPRPETLRLIAAGLQLTPAEHAHFRASARPRDTTPPERPDQAGWAPALHHLVGRHTVLGRLDAHLRGQGPPVLLLAGEPGIGKSRLLREAARHAVNAGWTVLAGGCRRQGGEEPYAPLLGALQQHLDGHDPRSLRRVLAGCAWLVRLLPELSGVLESLPDATIAPEHERRLVVGALARVLTNVAGPAGTLLLLDDLQWAGQDTLDLLATLVQHTGVPLRVAGAYRDTEVVAGALELTVADLAQAGMVSRYPLGPLSPEEAASLLDHLLAGIPQDDPDVAARVLERAGGVPFFLVSYAQSLRREGSDAIPWDVTAAVRQRVALAEGSWEVLGIGSVVGRRVPRALLLEVSEEPSEMVVAGLEAACRARLLLEDGPVAYVFAHDVIREVVEEDLGAARRANLHGRVAEVLERDPNMTSPENLAYHFSRSDAPERALPYLERAGDAAMAQYAYVQAEDHYRELVTRLDQMRKYAEAARKRATLGEILVRMGRYDEAIDVLEQAAAVLETAGGAEALARLAVEIGTAHGKRGTAADGIERLQALVAYIDGSDGVPSAGAAFSTLGRLLSGVAQFQESLTASTRAVELARVSGDRRTAALAGWDRLNALAALGRISSDDLVRCCEDALVAIEEVGDLDLLSRAHHDLAYMSAMHGELDAGRRHIDRALAAAEQLGDAGDLAFDIGLRGWLAFLRGDWRAARRDLETAAAESGNLGRSWYAPYPLIWLAELNLAEGRERAAAEKGEVAIALAEQNGDLQALHWASCVSARREMAEGQADAAAARLATLLEGAEAETLDVTMLLPWLAQARLEEGDVNRAAEIAAEGRARAEGERSRLALLDALRIQALIARQREQSEAAEQILEEALVVARSMPNPFKEACILADLGSLVGRDGNRARARERAEKALAIFRRLGAWRDIERVEQMLSTLRSF